MTGLSGTVEKMRADYTRPDKLTAQAGAMFRRLKTCQILPKAIYGSYVDHDRDAARTFMDLLDQAIRRDGSGVTSLFCRDRPD